MLLWAVLTLAVAALLIVGIERLLRRFGIQPQNPEDASGGAREVLRRIEEWQREHERRRR